MAGRPAPLTLIRGGLLVTPEGCRHSDLWIEGERIVAIGSPPNLEPDRTIDASGRYVLPGCVDVHTHMDLALVGNFDPSQEVDDAFAGESTADDFSSGAIAAAFGGTTTIVDFAEQARGETMLDGVANWHAKLKDAQPVIDVGFHLIVRDLGNRPAEDIAALIDQGVTSLKLFMAYKGDLMVGDDVIWQAMEHASQLGATVMVHAESGEVIDQLLRKARAEGASDPAVHAKTRPSGTEAEAVSRALAYAQLADCPLYVVHVSAAESVEAIARARSAGQTIWGETCTQYLVFDEVDLRRPEFEGAKYVFTPPPRGEADRERLWRALRTDVLSVISSDHSPASFRSRRELGAADFSKIPNGAGGVEERLMVVHHLGVNSERISLSRMVELLAANPARLMGLYPRKGALAVGSDADIVIFDPADERELNADSLHSRCDYSLYDRTVVRGAPETVLVRGKIVVDGDNLLADPGHGRFIPREPFARLASTHVAI